MNLEKLNAQCAIEELQFVEGPGGLIMAEVENDLALRLRRLMEDTNDPLIHGPVPRPPEEAAILERIWENVRKRKEAEGLR